MQRQPQTSSISPPQEQAHEVIDLTADPISDEEPLAIARVSHRAPTDIFSSQDSDDDIVVVNSRPASKRTHPLSGDEAARKRPATRQSSDAAEPEIVESRPVTVQERFARIQEMHRRGQVVESGPGIDNADEDPFDSIHAYSRYGPRPPRGFGGMPPSNRAPGIPIFLQNILRQSLQMYPGGSFTPDDDEQPRVSRYRYQPDPSLDFEFPDGVSAAQQRSTLEQRILTQTLQRSLSETTQRSRLDVRSLSLKTQPPEKAAEGFTLSVEPPASTNGEENLLMCTSCDNELGIGNPTDPSSQRVFVRGCGHAYCGVCVAEIDKTPPRSMRRLCPAAVKCRASRSKTKNVFREVYM